VRCNQGQASARLESGYCCCSNRLLLLRLPPAMLLDELFHPGGCVIPHFPRPLHRHMFRIRQRPIKLLQAYAKMRHLLTDEVTKQTDMAALSYNLRPCRADAPGCVTGEPEAGKLWRLQSTDLVHKDTPRRSPS
jgi:hypothetical protein